MAEAITYADLRFVKAPLKKSVSSRLGQDPEPYEDAELTYENVQVPPIPGGASGSASCGLGDKAGTKSERPAASWSSATSPAARRILPCPTGCLQYLLVGLLLTCLLLGVAAICLGVRNLQVSQQLQQVTRILEATNGSLRQQLRLKITQLGQKEEDLLGSRKELAQNQEALQVEQRAHQAAEEQLQACQSDREKTKEILKREEELRSFSEQRLNSTQETLKPFFMCPTPDTCCPRGWLLHQKSCFYFSPTKKTWTESQNHCKSLSSNLATLSEIFQYYYTEPQTGFHELLSESTSDSYWIGSSANKGWRLTDGLQYSSSTCIRIHKNWRWIRGQSHCTDSFPYICELKAFRFPGGDHSLHRAGYLCQQGLVTLIPNLWPAGPKIIIPWHSFILSSAQPRVDPCLTHLISLLPAWNPVPESGLFLGRE